MADNSNKGNPASKRMTNPRRKAARAVSWARGQRRKAARVEAQREREAANRQRRENGEPTPWEQSQIDRRDRRDKDPKVLKRREKHGKRRAA